MAAASIPPDSRVGGLDGRGTRLLAVHLPRARAAANVVFQLLSRRYERGSIILTSHMAFSEWGSFFADDVIATGILDRLLHQCEVIAINGPSYRLQYQTTSAESSAPLR